MPETSTVEAREGEETTAGSSLMAQIRTFNLAEMQRYQAHHEVDANYYLHERDGRKLLQINTYGRQDREMPGKASQSIQFDEVAAAQLFEIMKAHFGLK